MNKLAMNQRWLTSLNVLSAFLLVGLVQPVAAQQGKKVTEGKVSGPVQTTGKCSPLGALAYIPGRSYFARLVARGAVTVDGVPAGTSGPRFGLFSHVVGGAVTSRYNKMIVGALAESEVKGTRWGLPNCELTDA